MKSILLFQQVKTVCRQSIYCQIYLKVLDVIYEISNHQLVFSFVSGTHPVGVNPRSVVSMAEVGLHIPIPAQVQLQVQVQVVFAQVGVDISTHTSDSISDYLEVNVFQFLPQSKPPILTSLQTTNFDLIPSLQF